MYKLTPFYGLFQKVLVLLFLLSFSNCSSRQITDEQQEKLRIIVTCDPELDDSNSLVRFLLYSTDFRIEGLVYASSQYHWKGDGKGTKWFVPGREYTKFGLNMGSMESWRWAEDERFIHNAVEVYEEVYPNLKAHNPNYPAPEYLKSIIRYGNIEFDGDYSKDTPGSDLIKSLILDDVPGPLYITAWGGASTISRALKSIQDSCENSPEWEILKKKISRKVVICLSGDQDNTFENYISPNWPDIVSQQLSGGTVSLAYNAQNGATPENAPYYTPAWMSENISSKGLFGEFYRVWGDGKQMVEGDIFDYFGFSGISADELRKKGYIVWSPIQEKGSWLGEGDTHTFLNFIDNGLRAYEDPTYGGWSGRKRTGESQTPMPNFLPAAQNGLAARFKWSVSPNYTDANHEPIINAPTTLTAAPGEKVKLKVTVDDPDGDILSVNWWQFKVGSYQGDIAVDNPSSPSTTFIIPDDAEQGQTIHLILEAKDNGSPQLTRYHRVIVTVK